MKKVIYLFALILVSVSCDQFLQTDQPLEAIEDSALLSTGEAYDITPDCAKVKGSINSSSLMGARFGVDYSLDNDPRPQNGRTASSSRVSIGDDNTFSVPIECLHADTTYYYRVIAVDKNHYYMGDVKSFRTKKVTVWDEEVEIGHSGPGRVVLRVKLKHNASPTVPCMVKATVNLKKDESVVDYSSGYSEQDGYCTLPFSLTVGEEYEYHLSYEICEKTIQGKSGSFLCTGYDVPMNVWPVEIQPCLAILEGSVVMNEEGGELQGGIVFWSETESTKDGILHEFHGENVVYDSVEGNVYHFTDCIGPLRPDTEYYFLYCVRLFIDSKQFCQDIFSEVYSLKTPSY